MANQVCKTMHYVRDEFAVAAVAVEIKRLERTPVQWKAFAEVAVTVKVDGKKLVLEGDVLLHRYHK